MSLEGQKLLIANRGEIAVRILRTSKRLGIHTIAVYTQTDAISPHVLLADEAIPLHPDDTDPSSNAKGYLDASAIVDICKSKQVTLVHPGYGFLAENADFAMMLADAGITLLGPSAATIHEMGLKHAARQLAVRADVPVVPGSDGLLRDVADAVDIGERIGYPVMLKSTAGGGGMGLVICKNTEELRAKFISTQERAKELFQNDGLFIEKYFASSRHIEVQVFGNGLGHVIHMGERECSVQRRHQKVIEETPSPFFQRHPGIRDAMCAAALRLCTLIKYKSAGTCEFLVDDSRGDFYFLEMNTRLQVEHPITEAVYPGLDLVELMIRQGIAERESSGGLDPVLLHQERYDAPGSKGIHAIEARVYCENPTAQFRPCPGLLQHVKFLQVEWLRVESWVETGTIIPSFFDPLACKLVVTAHTRDEAITRLSLALSHTQIYGPPNNIPYLQAICESEVFKAGNATTTFLDAFAYIPRAMDVLAGGIETTIQDYPGRVIGLGVPRSGPLDSLAFRAANALVGNPIGTEGLEIALPGGTGGPKLLFHVQAVVAITGASGKVTLNGEPVATWSRLLVPAGGRLVIGAAAGRGQTVTGFRAYLAVRGGFPNVPAYLGSKSTSMGLGGYQGRSLAAGDQLVLGDCEPLEGEEPLKLPSILVPVYPSSWTVYTLAGPHDDPEFITTAGIEAFYATHWTISASSNRMGIRLEAGIEEPGNEIAWARRNGGEGGSHPSNIHDNGYALGSVNMNGDTPILLTNEGPSMGGYLCATTVASGDLWKLGQLGSGSTIQFERISFDDAMRLQAYTTKWVDTVIAIASGFSTALFSPLSFSIQGSPAKDPKLVIIPASPSEGRPRVIFRQAGDSAILVEYGELKLDFSLRARIHAFETEVQRRNIKGIWSFAPCIRSTMCHYDPSNLSQSEILSLLIDVEGSLPSSVNDMEFPGRKITFPIVLDDKWNREALQRYMRSTRDKAVYLPSNIQYLANNNGLEGGEEEALRLLVSSDWLVFGVGFYLACPFLVPIDPRCRLVGQKMNPSRTYTPRGAIGIAGLVAAIYPVESPGGYQLYGRTLPTWHTWGKGKNFASERPWLLQPFDQISFEPVSEEHYIQIEKEFDAGRYEFKIEAATLSMKEYMSFIGSIQDDVSQFKSRQASGVAHEEIRNVQTLINCHILWAHDMLREAQLLKNWQQSKAKSRGKSGSHGVDDQPDDIPPGSFCIVSSLSGTVWKINVKVGDVITDADDVAVVLEAMKTEVGIPAGEENVGRVVRRFGRGVREGTAVKGGDILVVLE